MNNDKAWERVERQMEREDNASDRARQLALSEERLGNALLELEQYKGKYKALNSAYKELLEQLFPNQNEATDSEGGRHIFYSEEDVR